MAGFKKGAWVTCALSEGEARKSLVMAASLKFVKSEGTKVVFVSNTVESNLRKQLEFSFDYVIPIESSRLKCGNDAPDDIDLLQKHLMNFHELEKCLYISPNVMAFQNPDSLFDFEEKPATPKPVAVNTPPVFVMKPFFIDITDSDRESERIGNENKSQKDSKLELMDNGLINFLRDPLEFITTPVEAFVNMEPFEILAAKTWINYYNEQFPQGPLQLQQLQPCLMNDNKEPIAIIGMSCRYPGANNLDEFWNLLINGTDAISTSPSFRWQSQHQLHSWPTDGSWLEAGFLKEDPTVFDYSFFGISPKAVMYMDPQTRLLLKVIWEGIENAGLDPSTLKGSNSGVFTGSWTNDYKDVLLESGNAGFYRRFIGNSIGAAASGISMLLGSTGPSIATESGCSSAMVAVHLACHSLRKRETNIGLAGGVNLLLSPYGKSFLPGFLSNDARCKTFDARANGFVRAEGCGVFVLKRLSDALENRDRIWGLIRGSAVAQEGLSYSMGTPTVECEALAMERALIDADVRPEQVSFVETHGTGTPTGDPIEIRAIAKAYYSKERTEPLFIGSVKTNVGHTESCSGMTGMMKTILAMKHGIIPPHRNVEKLNPAINFDAVPATIPLAAVEWKRKDGTSRIAGVSSFGITGTDAHAILEEAPPSQVQVQLGPTMLPTSPQLQLLKVSAKTETALNSLLEKYEGYLETTENSWEDVAYTANIGRGDFPWRATLVAKSKEEAVKQLGRNNDLLMKGHVSAESLPSICFLFTGQGSQYIGMGKQLFETCPVFQQHFDKCSKILLNQYKIDISQFIWSNNGVDELNKTLYSQTSIFCIQIALVKLWESWGVKPNFVLGHSLGEFAAAVCADILELEDAIKLVAERSLLVDALPKGKMLVIRSDHKKVTSIMERTFGENYLDVAAINSEEQTRQEQRVGDMYIWHGQRGFGVGQNFIRGTNA